MGRTIIIPTNRGLSLFVDSDADDGKSISAANFTIRWLSELYLNGATLNGTTQVSVEKEGLVEISGCIVSQESASPPFLINSCDAIIISDHIMESARLQNNATGQLDLTYVEFQDASTLGNSDGGTVRMSRLTLYEEFNEPSQENLGGGQVILEEATRRYDRLDDEENPLCLGNEAADLTLQLSSTECKERCENEFVCSGVLVYFDKDNEVSIIHCLETIGVCYIAIILTATTSLSTQAQCDICLRESDCAFNCSAVNSVYYKPKSNFHYTRVSACPALSRPFEHLEGANLEECKLYCSWYKSKLDQYCFSAGHFGFDVV